jgi:hypothetical protein
LKSLPCDIFLSAHGNYFGMENKYPRFKDEGLSVFLDPAGYKEYVEEREEAFKKELARQQTVQE